MGYMDKYSERPKKEKTAPADTAGETETFWTRNVKIITFCVTVGILLIAFLPFCFNFDKLFGTTDTRPEMTLNDVALLSDREGDVYLKELLEFRGDRQDQDSGIYYYISIGDDFQLLAVGDNENGKLHYLTLANLDTGKTVDVLKEDVRAFLTAK